MRDRPASTLEKWFEKFFFNHPLLEVIGTFALIAGFVSGVAMLGEIFHLSNAGYVVAGIGTVLVFLGLVLLVRATWHRIEFPWWYEQSQYRGYVRYNKRANRIEIGGVMRSPGFVSRLVRRGRGTTQYDPKGLSR